MDGNYPISYQLSAISFQLSAFSYQVHGMFYLFPLPSYLIYAQKLPFTQ
ncbi:hypothetical protein [Moorena sp. SIO2C4]|nr:hypothetical protein [Moorena sp. SIO2C4]